MENGGHYCNFVDGIWITRDHGAAESCKCVFNINGEQVNCPCCGYSECGHAHSEFQKFLERKKQKSV